MRTLLGRPGKIALAFAAFALALGGCTTGEDPAPSGQESASPSASGNGKTDTVTLILDWTPNTNHTGIYVALKQGLYEREGIDLQIKGYSQSGAEAVVVNGGADFAMSYLDGLAGANAAGGDLRMVYNLQQQASQGAAVRADSDIKSPKDLDGKVWAAASAADQGRRMREMIIGDGGKGEFDTVLVGTGAYEAVAQGRADFAEGLTTWEGIAFEQRGEPLRFFYPQDYGVATSPCNMGIATSAALINDNPDLVRRFVKASKEGFDFALNNPDEAADMLLEMAPEAKLDPKLVHASQKMLSADFWKDSRGETGLADLDRWQEYLDYIAEKQIILDADGKPLEKPQQVADMVTNDFVQ